MPNKKITVEVDLDHIENLIEFAKINLDMLNVDEFEDYRTSLYAVREAVAYARRKAVNAPA